MVKAEPNKSSGNWWERQKTYEKVLIILASIILVPIIWGVIFGSSNVSTESGVLLNKSYDIRLCQYELVSYYNTDQYILFNQKVNSCITKINELQVEIEKNILSETDETLKKEYQAMKLDVSGSAIYMNILTIEVSILSSEDGSLSQEQYKTKIDSIKYLYTQYLDILDKLEKQYSDTSFFKNNYGTKEGRELLQQAKANAQASLDDYNNLT